MTPVPTASKVPCRAFSHYAQSFVYGIFRPSQLWSPFGAHSPLHSKRRSKIYMTGSRLIDLTFHVSARFFSDILTQSVLFTLGTNSFGLTNTRTHIHLRPPGQTFLPCHSLPPPSLPSFPGAHHVRIPQHSTPVNVQKVSVILIILLRLIRKQVIRIVFLSYFKTMRLRAESKIKTRKKVSKKKQEIESKLE